CPCARHGADGARRNAPLWSWLFCWQLRPAWVVLHPAQPAAIKSVLLRFAAVERENMRFLGFFFQHQG
ncbi:hypothetical protein A2U01_0108012, partial [Trifolium medium]|nr:hypothetical protein [Trifolium medium]